LDAKAFSGNVDLGNRVLEEIIRNRVVVLKNYPTYGSFPAQFDEKYLAEQLKLTPCTNLVVQG